jgi:transposase
MKNYQLFVGVDISKESLDFCLTYGNSPLQMQHLKVANTTSGIKSVFRLIAKSKTDFSDVLFCMEDTGVYGLPLCMALEAQKADYAVVPAIHIKRSKGLKRGKSDKADAKDITQYAISHQHQIHLYQMPEPDMQRLKLMLAEREKLIKAMKLFMATGEALDFMDKKLTPQIRKHNSKTLVLLGRQLKELEAAILELVGHNEQMSHQAELLQSVPGIGPQTALQLICYTRCFSAFSNWRQLACYAGVAPFEYQSGSSIRGRTKVSHYAQKKLKSLLNMAALSAKRHDPELKQYFERKVAEGKNKMLVVNAIRCKLIARAFAVINRQSPFINLQKFTA